MKHKILSRFFLTTIFLISTNVFSKHTNWSFDGGIHNNSLAISPDEKLAIASYSEKNEVVIYDLKNEKLRKVLKGFVTPRNIIFSKNGKYFYISDSSLGVIKKIDTTNFIVKKEIPFGAGIFGTTINKEGDRLYVNNQAANTVTVYDLINERPVAVIPGFSQPRQGIKVSPDDKTIYVTNYTGDKIILIDGESNKIKGEINGFNKLRAISVSGDGRVLYAANSGNNTISVVDTEKNSIVDSIMVGSDPYGAALTPDNKFVYSGNLGDNSLSVIDTKSNKVFTTIKGFDSPRQAILFSHNNDKAWVLNKDLSISVVDLKTNKIVGKVK